VAILCVVARQRRTSALAMMTLALALQVVDLAGMVGLVRDVRAFGFRDSLVSRFWQVVPPQYDGLVLVPSNLCVPEGYLDFLPFALRAGSSGIGIIAGMTARYDVRKARAYCQQLGHQIRSGEIADRSLYVLRPDLVDEFRTLADGKASCTTIDGVGICFTPRSAARWLRSFDVMRLRLPDSAEMRGFYDALNETYRSTLGRRSQQAPGALDYRLEALTTYLAYRSSGCTHPDAEERIIGRLQQEPERGMCVTTAVSPGLPPSDETFVFSSRLRAWFGSRRDQVNASTHVDAEGESVWLQAYLRERLSGKTAEQAKATVLGKITQLASPRR